MANGEMEVFRDTIIMDYRAPADTTKTLILHLFTSFVFDPVQYQIIDVTGTGSRRKVALTINGRLLI